MDKIEKLSKIIDLFKTHTHVWACSECNAYGNFIASARLHYEKSKHKIVLKQELLEMI